MDGDLQLTDSDVIWIVRCPGGATRVMLFAKNMSEQAVKEAYIEHMSGTWRVANFLGQPDAKWPTLKRLSATEVTSPEYAHLLEASDVTKHRRFVIDLRD